MKHQPSSRRHPWISKSNSSYQIPAATSEAYRYGLTSLRGRRRLGGQLGRRGRGRGLRRRGRLLLGGCKEVGGVIVVDISKEIELVPRRHFRSALAIVPTRGTVLIPQPRSKPSTPWNGPWCSRVWTTDTAGGRETLAANELRLVRPRPEAVGR